MFATGHFRSLKEKLQRKRRAVAMNLAMEILATRAAARCAGAAAWPRCLHCNFGIRPYETVVASPVSILQLHYNARAPVHTLHCTQASARDTMHRLQCTRHRAKCMRSRARATMHELQCTTYSPRATIHELQCTTYSARATMYRKYSVIV